MIAHWPRLLGIRSCWTALLPLAAVALVPLPAHAAEPANAAPWQAELVSQADGELRSFYAYRSGPLWIAADGTLNPAASSLLELIRTSQYDGLDPASLGHPELEAAVAALGLASSPSARANAELKLSRAFLTYVKYLRDTSQTRMIYEHDLLRPYVPESYTSLEEAASAPSLEEYIRTMQWMHPLYAELRQALIAGQATANGSLIQVAQANLERIRALPASPGARYVLIDAAGARLWMYEGDQVVDSMKVVVGTAQTQTPIMAGYIRYAVFNPYWNVPPDLLRKNIAPRAKAQGQAYLRGRYQVVSDWTADAEVLPSTGVNWGAVAAGEVDLKVRQLPSATNAMGKMKFEFPNPQGIYLHDTPDKSLMLKEARQFSNGCIRLEDAERLGRWLMGGALPDVSKSPEQKVDLPAPVPIYVTYLTAHPEGGQLAVGGDPYGLDAVARPGLALNAR